LKDKILICVYKGTETIFSFDINRYNPHKSDIRSREFAVNHYFTLVFRNELIWSLSLSESERLFSFLKVIRRYSSDTVIAYRFVDLF